MKKIFFFALLAAAFIGFSPVTVFAEEAAKPCPVGCDCSKGGIRDMMEHQADLVQTKDAGMKKEVITKPASAKRLACTDQAIAKVTGALGKMFSNMSFNPSLTGGASNTAFCGLVSYPSLPSINLAGQLGAMLPDLMSLIPGFQLQVCTPPVPSPPNFSIGFGGSIAGCSIMSSIGAPQVPKPPPVCIKIETPGMNCLAIKGQWSGNPNSIKASGIVQGAPYTTFKDLLESVGDGATAKIGDHYKQQLDSDRAILVRAKNDLENTKEPGLTKSWKKPPSFGANASVDDVIQEMGKNPPTTSGTGTSASLPHCLPAIPNPTPDLPALPAFPPISTDLPSFDMPQTPQVPPIPSLGGGLSLGGGNPIAGIPGVNCIP
ncbi:MAG: hypothetical protein K8R48_06090 [Alphaproteobacteria bacterium]|nr:hypothetical protein [Alphaproteobacteria bacterium]